MSGAEIKTLRTEGKLDEALDMALSEYQESQNDPWAVSNLVWVYDAICKNCGEEGRLDDFCNAFKEIVSLNVLSTNEVLNNSLCWRFLSLLKSISNRIHEEEFNEAGDRLFTLAKELQLSIPSKQYTILLEAFLKLKDRWDGFYDFFEWWGFRNFTEEDYESRKLNNGKTMMSVAEEAFIAASKCLLVKKDVDKTKVLLSELEYVNEQHPRMTYIGFYIGKLLLSIGDIDNSFKKLLLFAKKKKDEFWVWQSLSETQTDEKIRLACLMRAEQCRTQDDYLVNVRQMLAKELINQRDYVSAKKQIEKLIQSRENNNWKIPNEVQSWVSSDWYKNPESISQANDLDFMKITNELLYPDQEEYTAVVSFVNVEKKMATIITGLEQSGFFNYERFHMKLQVGDILKIRANNKKGYINALSVNKSDGIENNDFYRIINASVNSNEEGRLYVPFEKKRLYLSRLIIQNNRIMDGDNLEFAVLFDYNKKYEKWQWCCVSAKRRDE